MLEEGDFATGPKFFLPEALLRAFTFVPDLIVLEFLLFDILGMVMVAAACDLLEVVGDFATGPKFFLPEALLRAFTFVPDLIEPDFSALDMPGKAFIALMEDLIPCDGGLATGPKFFLPEASVARLTCVLM